MTVEEGKAAPAFTLQDANGNKVALKDLAAGDTVFKYGEDIGKMVGDAGVGEHVHTHNCKTKRW